MTMMTKPLTGIVPPLITPLRDRDALDEPGLERLIEHVLGGRVSGLFILGTTGEGPSLGYRLRRELIERTCRQVRGRVPVLVGITDTAVVEALDLARCAAEAGPFAGRAEDEQPAYAAGEDVFDEPFEAGHIQGVAVAQGRDHRGNNAAQGFG